MAVSIRMRRAGTKNTAFYHVVVIDSHKARNGKYVEKLGFYNPTSNPPVFQVDRERTQYWVGVGAQVSRTVAQCLKRKKTQDAPAQG